MRVIAQNNREWICIECKHFLYVFSRNDNTLDLICTNVTCMNKDIMVRVELEIEYVNVQIIEKG